MAFASDWPVVPIDPLLGMFVAVHRRSPAMLPSQAWRSAGAVTPQQAMLAHTQGAAFACGLEHEVGSLRYSIICLVGYRLLGSWQVFTSLLHASAGRSLLSWCSALCLPCLSLSLRTSPGHVHACAWCSTLLSTWLQVCLLLITCMSSPVRLLALLVFITVVYCRAGMRADFTVLDGNMLEALEGGSHIPTVKATFVNGIRRYGMA